MAKEKPMGVTKRKKGIRLTKPRRKSKPKVGNISEVENIWSIRWRFNKMTAHRAFFITREHEEVPLRIIDISRIIGKQPVVEGLEDIIPSGSQGFALTKAFRWLFQRELINEKLSVKLLDVGDFAKYSMPIGLPFNPFKRPEPVIQKVGIRFPSSPHKNYYYLAYDMDIKVGDVVIVDSPVSGLTLVEVFWIGNASSPNVQGCSGLKSILSVHTRKRK